jgi:hypothetical protein
MMPELDGISFSRTPFTLPGPYAPIVVITAARDPRQASWRGSRAQLAREIGAQAYIQEPFDLDDMPTIIDTVIAHGAPAGAPAGPTANGAGSHARLNGSVNGSVDGSVNGSVNGSAGARARRPG